MLIVVPADSCNGRDIVHGDRAAPIQPIVPQEVPGCPQPTRVRICSVYSHYICDRGHYNAQGY